MKRVSLTVVACSCFGIAISQTTANKKNIKPYDWSDRNNNTIYRSDSLTKKGFTLIFLVQDSTFNAETQQKLTDAFFTVYPQEVKRFNRDASKKIVFIIDPSYDGVAAASNSIIRCNPEWMKKHPEDIDVITHEAMHVVQAYHKGHTPGWLTEGIADYVRYKYGVNNEKGGWQLPTLKPDHHYTSAYRVTARFLVWVEEHVDRKIVDKMNAAAYKGEYKDALWVEYTGKTVDQLWEMYAKAQEAKQ
jgi:hypothetical protein